MIEIIFNGEKKELADALTIDQMIVVLHYHDKTFAVAVNGTFVPLELYRETKIKAGDEIEILAPMVGG